MITERDIGKSLPQIWTGEPARGFSASLFDDLELLDDFNRANEDPLSKSNAWDTRVNLGGAVTLEVSSNVCAQLDSPSTGRSVWAAGFDQDQAACITVPTLPVDSDDALEISLRVATTGSGAVDSGYAFRVFPAAASNQFECLPLPVTTPLFQATQAFSAGDKFGASAVGSLLTMWYGTGGAWTCVAAIRDETYVRAGKIGLGIRDTEGRLDDFRAGSLT